MRFGSPANVEVFSQRLVQGARRRAAAQAAKAAQAAQAARFCSATMKLMRRDVGKSSVQYARSLQKGDIYDLTENSMRTPHRAVFGAANLEHVRGLRKVGDAMHACDRAAAAQALRMDTAEVAVETMDATQECSPFLPRRRRRGPSLCRSRIRRIGRGPPRGSTTRPRTRT